MGASMKILPKTASHETIWPQIIWPETICVVGLGYIGLPTSALLARNGYRVMGADLTLDVVDSINMGRLHFEEPGLDVILRDAVASGNLDAATTPRRADIFIIAVPTPITKDRQPDLRAVFKAAEAIFEVAAPGALIILESTSPVGTTEQLAHHLGKIRPDLMQDKQSLIDFAYAPERVIPGKIVAEITTNDRVVGGITPQATARAAKFYRSWTSGNVHECDARTAEMVKLTENSSRDVSIAFANELSIICDKIGVDVWALIELANHHPRVNILNPGPGVGGHCIAVDPWFIVAAAPDEAQLIRQARLVNDAKPAHVIREALTAAASIDQARIACLGLTFKANVDDLRESPALDIALALNSAAQVGQLILCDPLVRHLPTDFADAADVIWESDPIRAVAQADVVLLLVDHDRFRDIPLDALQGRTVIDTRGFWRQQIP